jgi:hypothetical protein
MNSGTKFVLALAFIVITIVVGTYAYQVNTRQLVEVVNTNQDTGMAEVVYEVQKGHAYESYYAILPMKYVEMIGDKNYAWISGRIMKSTMIQTELQETNLYSVYSTPDKKLSLD